MNEGRKSVLPITIAIPTYRREQVLIDTLDYLLGLAVGAAEIVVLDQTEVHEPEIARQLNTLANNHRIRLVTLKAPSIPGAMNRGLLEATQEIVLFVDDDIRPEPELLMAHLAAHKEHPDILVAGRVIQPWEERRDFSIEEKFSFANLKPNWISEFIGCNFSLRRQAALALGGFDENFVRVAYRFEAEFAHRFLASGRRIYFEPRACLHHLKATGGGTRTYGEHLTTLKPFHAVGAYYFFLRTWTGWHSLKAFLGRPLSAVATRHHLRNPWWIPVTGLAEILGMFWAFALFMRGPRYVSWPDPAKTNA